MSKYSGQIRCKKFCAYNAAKERNEFRLAPVRYTTFDRNYFVEMAANDAGITEEQMNAALRAYQTQFDQLLLNGHSIQLGGLGNFRLSMSFDAVENIEDVNIDEQFKRLRVVLRPSKDLRDDMKSINHIVDPLQTVASGNSVNRQYFYLNYQLPTPVTIGVQSNLTIKCTAGLINLSSMSSLRFMVGHPEYGPATLTISGAPGINTTFTGQTTGGHEYSLSFAQTGGEMVIDEAIGFTGGGVIKAFLGQ